VSFQVRFTGTSRSAVSNLLDRRPLHFTWR
jgi:hypothetical protein